MILTIGNLYYTINKHSAWVLNDIDRKIDIIDLQIGSEIHLQHMCIQNTILLYLGPKKYIKNIWRETKYGNDNFGMELASVQYVGNLFLADDTFVLLEAGNIITNEI